MRLRSFTCFAVLTLVAGASACETCKKDYTFGQPTVVGLGMAWTWVRVNPETKKPVSIGITLTETALQGLAEEPPEGMVGMEYLLELPESFKGQPFDHVGLDWNPKGHIPPGIYDVPHFDMHFYTVSTADRKKMLKDEISLKRAGKQPDTKFVMSGYILPPGTYEPNMGSHWVNPAAPELNKQPFTHTFLYGSYDGRTAFFEPMVTRAFLEGKSDVTVDLAMPAAYQRSGYYPSSYRISFDAKRKEYTISLEGLVYHKATK